MNKVHYNVTRLQNIQMKTQVKNVIQSLYFIYDYIIAI